MNIGRIVSRAWRVTWRHKVLWLYGIVLALCGASTVGTPPKPSFQYTLRESDLQLFWRRLPGLPWMPHGATPFGPFGLWDWRALAGGVALLAVILMAVGLVLTIIRAIIRYTSMGALVHMVDEVEETEATAFRSGLGAGWRNLLKLFVIDLLVGLAAVVIGLGIGLVALLGLAFAIGPAVALSNAGGLRVLAVLWAVLAGLGILAIIFVLAVAVTAFFTILREFSYRFGVLDDASIFEAIGRGYRLLCERLRPSLLTWLVMVAISLALALLMAPLAMVIMMAISGGAWMIVGRHLGSALVALLIVAPIVLVVAALVILVSGLFSVFSSAVWTLAYRELASVPAKGV